MSAFLCCHLRCIPSSFSVGNFSGQPGTLQETSLLILSLCHSPMCLFWLAVLKNFCIQNRHGTSFINSEVYFKTSPHRAVHITFTTFETWACLANVCLTCCTCVSAEGVVVSSPLGTSAPSGISALVRAGWAAGCGASWAAAAGFLWCLLVWVCSAFWSLHIK